MSEVISSIIGSSELSSGAKRGKFYRRYSSLYNYMSSCIVNIIFYFSQQIQPSKEI